MAIDLRVGETSAGNHPQESPRGVSRRVFLDEGRFLANALKGILFSLQNGLAIAAVIFFLALPQRAHAWGQEGHSIVAEFAERRLDNETLPKVKTLLGGVSMASVASWADDYRADHPESGGWHFVNFLFDQAAHDPARDCKPEAGDCIIHAIARFRNDRNNCAKSPSRRVPRVRTIC